MREKRNSFLPPYKKGRHFKSQNIYKNAYVSRFTRVESNCYCYCVVYVRLSPHFSLHGKNGRDKDNSKLLAVSSSIFVCITYKTKKYEFAP